VNSPLPASLLSQARKAVAKAETYIHSRRSREEGYCFYKSEYVDEPNLCDTYHAVAALRLIGAGEPRTAEIVQFVEQCRIFGVNYLYWYAFTLDCLGRASSVDPDRLSLIRSLTIAPPPEEHRLVSEWLEDACKTVRLMRRFAEIPKDSHAVGFITSLKAEGGYGDPPSLIDTYVSLTILSQLGKLQATRDTHAFLDQRQVPSFGFAFASGSSMTNLDVICAGMKACRLLNVQIKYQADVLAYVPACQDSNGGFARTLTGLPDLELTHRGLEVIALLAPELSARDKPSTS
jgi:hypothetical protein